MLRRMESTGQGALGLRVADWDGAARLARRALGWTALAGVMFVLCRGRVSLAGEAGRLAPFAMAFFAAALLANRAALAGFGAAALLVGCLAGALGGEAQPFDLRLPVGAAVVLAGSLARDFAGPALRRGLRGIDGVGRLGRAIRGLSTGHAAGSPAPNRLARSPNDDLACATLAGLGTLLPGLLMMSGPLWPEAAEATAASLAAVAAAPFFRAALAADRRSLSPDARIGGCVLLGALCLGLARLSTPVACLLGAGLTLMMAPAGGLAGIGFGGALVLGTGDARLLALLAAIGAAAQLCAGSTRPTRSLACCAATLAAGLALNLAPPVLAGALMATPLTLPVPEEWARVFLLLCRSPADPRRQAEAARRSAAGRVLALAEALGEAEDVTLNCARQAMEALAGALEEPPRRVRPRLRVEKGAATAPMTPGLPNGDSCLVCRLDGTRLLALVSDGMGSGIDAARESRAAARLLARLIRAGSPMELAAEAANALLMDRFGEDMFATADALALDLATGAAEWVKLAACPTLILRGGEVLRVAGGRLPLGILEGVRPQAIRTRLLPGDAVLMTSDGVFDALGAEALEDILLDCGDLPAGEIARRAVDAAEASAGRRDDMTALCLKVSAA